MIIKTASGAVYTIKHGICYKVGSDGCTYAPFKVYTTKAVPLNVKTVREVHATPEGKPEIGKLLYVSGRDDDWLSTEVVSIEEGQDEY